MYCKTALMHRLFAALLTITIINASPQPPANPEQQTNPISRTSGIRVKNQPQLRLDTSFDTPQINLPYILVQRFLNKVARDLRFAPGNLIGPDGGNEPMAAELDIRPMENAPYQISNTAAGDVAETLEEWIRNDANNARTLSFYVEDVNRGRVVEGFLRRWVPEWLDGDSDFVSPLTS